MVSMAASLLLLLACGAHATGKSYFVDKDGHGHIAHYRKHGHFNHHKHAVAPVAQDTVKAVPAVAPHRKNSSVTTDLLKRLDTIYSGHSLHAFWKAGDYKSSQKELALSGVPAQAVLYAEIQPEAFMELLQHVGFKPGMKYYDLGSGTGKTVFSAWLLGLNATGVELVEKRWATSCEAVTKAEQSGMKKAKKGPGVHFVHTSFLDIDFDDADILFTDSASFSKDMMTRLAKAASRLRPGSKIISSTGFPGEGFNYEEKVVGKSSKSLGTTWTVQTVKDPSEDTETQAAPEKKILTSEVRPASLIRQEQPIVGVSTQAPPPHKRPTGPKQEGPILGAIHIPEKKVAAQGTVCSLAEAEDVPLKPVQMMASMMHKKI